MEELKGTQEVRALLGAVLPAEVAPRTFEVICMRSGEANGLYYPAEALQRSVQEGALGRRNRLCQPRKPCCGNAPRRQSH